MRIELTLAYFGLTAVAGIEPCGQGFAQCPSDQTCVYDHGVPYGICHFKIKYAGCGGKRFRPVTCPPGTACRPDPRLLSRCGGACDVPGICIPERPHHCRGVNDLVCPQDTHCYGILGMECASPTNREKCLGWCL